jgi:hypothetical protein
VNEEEEIQAMTKALATGKPIPGTDPFEERAKLREMKTHD